MDDSGVNLDQSDGQLSNATSDCSSGLQTAAGEKCDDSRCDVSCDSSLDITCWEQLPFWMPSPQTRCRRMDTDDCCFGIKIPGRLRVSPIRPRNDQWPEDGSHVSMTPEPDYSPYVIAFPNEAVLDRRDPDYSEPAVAGYTEDFGFVPYESDFFEHRKYMEMLYHPTGSLDCQPVVTEFLRTQLVERMTRNHHHLDLKVDSLFLAVNIVDRFLITTPISTNCMHLLGLTATLIASKMNETYPPTIRELLALTGNTYSPTQLKELERMILNRLHFHLLVPTAIFFMEHFVLSHMRSPSFLRSSYQTIKHVRVLCRYVLKASLANYTLCQFRPSLLALAALIKVDRFLNKDVHLKFADLSQYEPRETRECMEKLQPVIELVVHENGLERILGRYMHDYDSEENV